MGFERFERELLPSAEDIAFYRAHGWYVSPKIIPDEMLEQAARGSERFYAGERDDELPPESERFDWRPEQGNVLRLNSYASLRNREIRNLVMLPIIGAVASLLAGSKTIRLFRDSLIYKPPESEGSQTLVGWHVDRAYWLTCTSDNMLTAFVPFHDCDESTGTLTVLDGSHLWPDNLDMRTSLDQDLDGLVGRLNTGGRPIIEVPIRFKRGQVSFHHCRTVHGSHANHTGRPRVSVAIHMQDGENRYRPFCNADGKRLVHLNDIMCRQDQDGEPDYSDPYICPVMWGGEEQN